MKPIIDPRIEKTAKGYRATCKCGSIHNYPSKDTALKMLKRGSCKFCKKDYRDKNGDGNGLGIYKNKDGKWCSACSNCGVEQAYTRKEHARNSTIKDQHCKKCANKLNKFSRSGSVGPKTRLFNKFSKSAIPRKIGWELTEEEMFLDYNGKCALTGWDIDISYQNCTASLDRIDSKGSYNPNNIQWVHSMVNMCKNKYDLDIFVQMCKAIVTQTNKQTNINGDLCPAVDPHVLKALTN